MATMKASEKRKKDKKKAKKGKSDPVDDDLDGQDGADAAEELDADALAKSKAPIEMTADQLMEEEWGEDPKPKKGGKKGKKGGKKQAAADYDEDEFLNEQMKGMSVEKEKTQEAEQAAKQAEPTPEAAAPKDDEAQDDDGAPKLLSKKEKERLKKEKEKVRNILTWVYGNLITHIHSGKEEGASCCQKSCSRSCD